MYFYNVYETSKCIVVIKYKIINLYAILPYSDSLQQTEDYITGGNLQQDIDWKNVQFLRKNMKEFKK